MPYRHDKKPKRVTDKGGNFSPLLTDLSKALCYPTHDLITTELDANGFKMTLFIRFSTTLMIKNKE